MNKKIGILGGGQLGRMLAQSAKSLDVEVKIVDESEKCSASKVFKTATIKFANKDQIADYFSDVDVITYEFENIPHELVEYLAQKKLIYPPLSALYVTRNRAREKQYASSVAIPTPRFITANSFSELLSLAKFINFPVVVKTCSEGYDGKGQWRFASKSELEKFCNKDANFAESLNEIIAEEMIHFDFEISCIAARDVNGEVVFYSMCENQHDHGILSSTISPSKKVSKEIENLAKTYTKKLLDSLSYVGVIAVEYFVRGGELLFNEFAPRVHNSGHWTIEGAETSQFENHIRACCEMELGSTKNLGFSLMLNLLGTTGNREEVLKNPNAYYHWYEKEGLGIRRKVGHITFVFPEEEDRDKLDRLKFL